MNLQTILSQLQKVKQTSDNQWQACCPAHEDDHPSLCISVGRTGAPLLYCQAGCSFEAVREACGIPKVNGHRLIVAEYDYTDEFGELLYQKVRHSPKDFRQRRPDGNGGWRWNLKDVRRVLYRLPAVRQAIAAGLTLYLVEGEKDADRLASLGLVATTNPEGAAKDRQKPKWREEYTEQLRGAQRVVLLPDNDEPGSAHMRAVAKALAGVVPDIRAVELPGLPEKGDVSDWLNAGHTAEELQSLAAAAQPFQPKPDHPQAGAPAADADPGPQEPVAARGAGSPRLVLNAHGKPVPCLANVLEVLRADSRWQGVLGFDEFAERPMLTGRPPWDSGQDDWALREVTDADETLTTEWVQRHYRVFAGPDAFSRAINAIAKENPFHPVREYLGRLAWDGTPRVDSWIIDHLGAEKSDYVRMVSSKILIGAVARIYRPGCKVDHSVILEGRQGLGKTTSLEILASAQWFSDSLSFDLGSKDAMQQLPGIWFNELGELNALTRSEAGAVKRFVSATQDHYRPSYGRRSVTIKRQGIFAGTTNSDSYLKDETGNRRFWPVRVTKRCAFAALQAARDQIWAEAVHRFKQGEKWYDVPANLAKEVLKQQSDRAIGDEWEVPVFAYLDGKRCDDTSIGDLLRAALGLEPKDWRQLDQTRIAKILIKHGWRKYRAREGDDREYRYKRPPPTPPDAPPDNPPAGPSGPTLKKEGPTLSEAEKPHGSRGGPSGPSGPTLDNDNGKNEREASEESGRPQDDFIVVEGDSRDTRTTRTRPITARVSAGPAPQNQVGPARTTRTQPGPNPDPSPPTSQEEELMPRTTYAEHDDHAAFAEYERTLATEAREVADPPEAKASAPEPAATVPDPLEVQGTDFVFRFWDGRKINQRFPAPISLRMATASARRRFNGEVAEVLLGQHHIMPQLNFDLATGEVTYG